MAIVTLTSDFGTRDGYVGAMKGVILSRAADARVVDIAHDVPACNVASGAYCLAQAAPFFPAGTIHVAVVDPGVGTGRLAVIAVADDHVFIGPDNGLLTLAVPEPRAVYVIEDPGFVRESPSATFHGRDIFAAAAGSLAAGAKPEHAGRQVALSPLERSNRSQARRSGSFAPAERASERPVAVVVHVDRFGNLITSYPGDRVPSDVRIQAGPRVIAGLSRTFADVERNEAVAYIGSGGTLEIAVREASAAEILGLSVGDVLALGHGT